MMSDNDNKNMFLAMGLSMVVILGWMYFFPVPLPEPEIDTPSTDKEIITPPGQPADSATFTPTTRDQALQNSPRIPIRTPRLNGSIALQGARLDDLQLSDYNLRLNDPTQKITLLSPASSPNPYYAVHGWAPSGSLTYQDMPIATTIWQAEKTRPLTVNSPVTLKWDNGKGLIFRRTISVDETYLFTITQSVHNKTTQPVTLSPYGIIVRKGEPETIGFYILHEGVVRASDGKIEEIDYDDMPDQAFNQRENANINAIDVTQSGWIGFTDKYWMTTLIPDSGQAFKSVVKYTQRNDTYQTDMRLLPQTVPAGEQVKITTHLFAGAKEYDAINFYQIAGVQQFVDSIDWGWFFFLTKPIFKILHFLNGIIGNMGWAIIGLTLIIKTLLFPLAYKSYVSMARMKDLQPEMEKLKQKYGDDRQAMQQGMMNLYREKKINPAAGCLPILLQIPIFFSLYKVIFVTIEMYHAPFIFWIADLSAPDPTSFFNLFGFLPWAAPASDSLISILSIGVFPILMGVTMWLQQKLNPAPADKMQAQIFAWMPWIFMFMLGQFAAGLVIYWVANNTLTFMQQYAIMHSQGVKPDVFGNIFNRPTNKTDRS